MLFLALELIPVAQDLLGRADLDRAENMRMAVDQLFADTVRHVADVEHAFFLFHLGVEHDLQQHVAELFFQMLGVLLVDRLADLIGLLNEVAADGLVILLPIPHAAVRRTQDLHDP